MNVLRTFIAVLIAFIIPLGFYFYFNGKEAPRPPKLRKYFPISTQFHSDYTTKVGDSLFHQVPAFEFLDQDSLLLTQKNFEDNIYVANFFFSSCPGICPIISTSIARVQDRLSDEPNLMFLSHTIDPATDRPERLKSYGRKFKANFNRWKFVTGYDMEAFYEYVKKAYYVTVLPGDPKETNILEHTNKLVLVDRNRIIRGYYDGTDSMAVNKLMYDIRVLQLEYKVRNKVEYKPASN